MCLALVAMLAGGLLSVPSGAALPEFGPAIDEVGYDGQTKCSPEAKPGMLAFRRMVLARYPTTGLGGISRACNIGGQSEHKEGRAWDWPLNASFSTDREKAQDLFEWLLADDRYANSAALAKRLGIMYMIWNRRIWGSWGGWQTYCVQKKRGCVDPEDRDLRHPHTDHVHFSMSRAGAAKRTTFWNPDRSMLADLAADPGYGYLQLARNGAVGTFGTSWYGSKADEYLEKPASTIASTVTGSGYWVVTKGGRVFPFGDARNRGQIIGKRLTVVDIEPTPSGGGYWLLAKSGRIFPYGDAVNHGGAKESGVSIAAMASTPTGLGYWLFGSNGNVFAYGDAQDLGGLADESLPTPVVGGDNFGAAGYWLATAGGRVAGFGGARSLGDARAADLGSPVVGFAADASGTGYWMLTEMGDLMTFGEAPALGSFGS